MYCRLCYIAAHCIAAVQPTDMAGVAGQDVVMEYDVSIGICRSTKAAVDFVGIEKY